MKLFRVPESLFQSMGTRGFIVKCGRYLLVFVGAAVTAGATVAAAAAAAEAGTVAGSWPRISADAEAFAKAFQGVTATIDISEEEVAWVDVIAGQWMGVALPGGPAANSTEVPLHGFMRETEFLRSLHHQLPPVPVVLSCDRALIAERAGAALKIPEPSPGDSVVRLPSGSTLGLKFAGKPVAVLHNVEVFDHRKEERATRTFGTASKDHPYIRNCTRLQSREFVFARNAVCVIVSAIFYGVGLSRLYQYT